MSARLLNQVLNSLFPDPDRLIELAKSKLGLKYTNTSRASDDLGSMVEAYMNFVQTFDIHDGYFWVYGPNEEFPLEHFKLSLEMFLMREEPLMRNLKHEHLRVLFFIAALRYRNLGMPRQQNKIHGCLSKVRIFDLFLFDKETAYPHYSLQIRFLNGDDLGEDGTIKDSLRGKDLLEKGVRTFRRYGKSSLKTLRSQLRPVRSGETTTQAFVVLVTPYKVVWLDGGFYREEITSSLIEQPQENNYNEVPMTISQSQWLLRERGNNMPRVQAPSLFGNQNLQNQYQQTQENLIASRSQQNHPAQHLNLRNPFVAQSEIITEDDIDNILKTENNIAGQNSINVKQEYVSNQDSRLALDQAGNHPSIQFLFGYLLALSSFNNNCANQGHSQT